MLLVLDHFLVLGLDGGKLLSHLVLLVLDQRLVLKLELEFILLLFLLELLLDFFDHDFLRLHDLVDFRHCSLRCFRLLGYV